jgi:hypothetical protein
MREPHACLTGTRRTASSALDSTRSWTWSSLKRDVVSRTGHARWRSQPREGDGGGGESTLNGCEPIGLITERGCGSGAEAAAAAAAAAAASARGRLPPSRRDRASSRLLYEAGSGSGSRPEPQGQLRRHQHAAAGVSSSSRRSVRGAAEAAQVQRAAAACRRRGRQRGAKAVRGRSGAVARRANATRSSPCARLAPLASCPACTLEPRLVLLRRLPLVDSSSARRLDAQQER